MKIVCEGFYEFVKKNKRVAEKMLESKNFMKAKTEHSLLLQLDTAFAKIYRGLAKFKLIWDKLKIKLNRVTLI